MKDDLWLNATFAGKWPFMEDDLWWGKNVLEVDLWWKISFDGRRPLMEDKRQLLMKDNLWWKTTFDQRQPSMENFLQCATPFSGTHPSQEDNLWLKTEDSWETTFENLDLWGTPVSVVSLQNPVIGPCRARESKYNRIKLTRTDPRGWSLD